MLEEMQTFLGRFAVHLSWELTQPLREIIIEILGQLLVTIGVVIKTTRKGRIGNIITVWISCYMLKNLSELYVKGLVGKNTESRNAIEKLRNITSKEVPMVAAVTLATVQQIKGILYSISSIDCSDYHMEMMH